jgi:hypothetical protein
MHNFPIVTKYKAKYETVESYYVQDSSHLSHFTVVEN